MGHVDEEIIELKRKKMHEDYQTMEKGFYIYNKVVHFERVSLSPMSLSIMLPPTFVTMSRAIVKMKYQSENRPQLIKTSLDTKNNFAFSILKQKIGSGQLKQMGKQIITILKRFNPANTFYEENEGETIDGKIPYYCFDYKGYAIDEQIYNLMYIMPLKNDYMLHGVFNCVFQDKDEWKQAVYEAIKSIVEEDISK